MISESNWLQLAESGCKNKRYTENFLHLGFICKIVKSFYVLLKEPQKVIRLEKILRKYEQMINSTKMISISSHHFVSIIKSKSQEVSKYIKENFDKRSN